LELESLEVSVVTVGQVATVVLKGEIDPATADLFAEGLAQASTQAPRVVVDMGGVTFIDSTGLRVLLEARERSGQNGEALVISAPSTSTRRLFEISQLDELFTIEP